MFYTSSHIYPHYTKWWIKNRLNRCIFKLEPDCGKTRKEMKYPYLAISGTMGSGKTTAARLLAKHLKFDLLEENFGENAFLPGFYRDMKRWAFHSQTFFLMEKITQIFTTQKSFAKKSIIQDTPIYQDVFSYARALHVGGNMDDNEWRLYLKIYRSFMPYLPKPTHIIYLKTSLEVVKSRISSRARDFEKKVPDGYLELLEMLNESWMKKEADGMKIITVETDRLNLIRNKSDIRNFITIVTNQLRI